jgi:hypothetical protein
MSDGIRRGRQCEAVTMRPFVPREGIGQMAVHKQTFGCCLCSRAHSSVAALEFPRASPTVAPRSQLRIECRALHRVIAHFSIALPNCFDFLPISWSALRAGLKSSRRRHPRPPQGQKSPDSVRLAAHKSRCHRSCRRNVFKRSALLFGLKRSSTSNGQRGQGLHALLLPRSIQRAIARWQGTGYAGEVAGRVADNAGQTAHKTICQPFQPRPG